MRRSKGRLPPCAPSFPPKNPESNETSNTTDNTNRRSSATKWRWAAVAATTPSKPTGILFPGMGEMAGNREDADSWNTKQFTSHSAHLLTGWRGQPLLLFVRRYQKVRHENSPAGRISSQKTSNGPLP